ncbi:MAG: protease modulator HflC [Proteobacteria bacterium]|nr:protease modulator HflC [Pseudomonadota bacterium]
MNKRLIIIGVVTLVAVFVAMGSMFTVSETQQAIVVRFGNPKHIVQNPGLHFKVPFIEDVRYLDKRLLNLDIPAQEVIAADQKRLVVDAIARFRIVDPLLMYTRVRTENGARQQLNTVLISNIRQVLGSEVFVTLLSGERAELMHRIRDNVNRDARNYGIEIVDVRIKRADLPAANSEAIFSQMRTAREREAREARAEGLEQAVGIRARADRDRTILLAEARKKSEILRGEGEGQAVKIFADAFSTDEDFFEFYRSMQAYKKALGNDDTTLILSPDSEFFKFFRSMDPGKGSRR